MLKIIIKIFNFKELLGKNRRSAAATKVVLGKQHIPSKSQQSSAGISSFEPTSHSFCLESTSPGRICKPTASDTDSATASMNWLRAKDVFVKSEENLNQVDDNGLVFNGNDYTRLNRRPSRIAQTRSDLKNRLGDSYGHIILFAKSVATASNDCIISHVDLSKRNFTTVKDPEAGEASSSKETKKRKNMEATLSLRKVTNVPALKRMKIYLHQETGGGNYDHNHSSSATQPEATPYISKSIQDDSQHVDGKHDIVSHKEGTERAANPVQLQSGKQNSTSKDDISSLEGDVEKSTKSVSNRDVDVVYEGTRDK